jgi:hypothetical protein
MAVRTPTEEAMARRASCSEVKSSGRALMAATGCTPWRRTISRCWRRFAAPMSEPNPAPFTRYSPARMPTRSATTDELP